MCSMHPRTPGTKVKRQTARNVSLPADGSGSVARLGACRLFQVAEAAKLLEVFGRQPFGSADVLDLP